ncbi:hypothetical protein V6N11_073664 [Hibiscus sabdariffa]|uniref:Uncharacterized protein n=2 Tax=Hibiscus sabdariffa TaxID=183260 RepID=A0ABR2NU20_9ROSI
MRKLQEKETELIDINIFESAKLRGLSTWATHHVTPDATNVSSAEDFSGLEQKRHEAPSKFVVHQSTSLRVLPKYTSLAPALATQSSVSTSPNSTSAPTLPFQHGHGPCQEPSPVLSASPTAVDAVNAAHTQLVLNNDLVTHSCSHSQSANTQNSPMMPCNGNLFTDVQQEPSGWNPGVAETVSPNSVGTLHSSSS